MKNQLFFLAFASVALLVSCGTSNFDSPKDAFTVEEALEISKGDAIFIDVRQPEELFEVGYGVKNLINIPLDALEGRINDIPKNKQVIVACRSGNRSGQAFEILKKKGFTNVANLVGGMNAWSEAGLPTKSGLSTEVSMAGNQSTDKLEVFVFHGVNQCMTCKNLKAHARYTIETYFADELKDGEITFQIIDVDDPQNAELAEKFEAAGTALMVNQIKGGHDNIIDLSDFAFEKANTKEEFVAELSSKLKKMSE